jgi:hypothetical protein
LEADGVGEGADDDEEAHMCSVICYTRRRLRDARAPRRPEEKGGRAAPVPAVARPAGVGGA